MGCQSWIKQLKKGRYLRYLFNKSRLCINQNTIHESKISTFRSEITSQGRSTRSTRVSEYGGDVVELPRECRDGLASVAHKGDFEVHVLSYHHITNVFVGVRRINCEEHSGRSRFMSLLQLGVPIPLCADYIRMKALSSYTGWLIDCDTLWLRSPPFSLDWPCYGHVFGSMEAGHRTFREGAVAAWRRWSI